MIETGDQQPAAAATRRRRWVVLGVVAAIAAAVTIAAGLVLPMAACGCAIPPDDDAAIETARDYVATVAAGTTEVSDDDRAGSLAALDDPATVWTVVYTRRPGGGYGDSPAVRVVVGLAPDDTWDALVVRSETDYRSGDVDLEVRHLADSGATTVRGGTTPLFDTGNSSSGDDYDRSVVLLATGREPEPLAALENSQVWAYTGEGLAPGRYLVVDGGENRAEDPPQPYVTASWFEVPAASG